MHNVLMGKPSHEFHKGISAKKYQYPKQCVHPIKFTLNLVDILHNYALKVQFF